MARKKKYPAETSAYRPLATGRGETLKHRYTTDGPNTKYRPGTPPLAGTRTYVRGIRTAEEARREPNVDDTSGAWCVCCVRCPGEVITRKTVADGNERCAQRARPRGYAAELRRWATCVMVIFNTIPVLPVSSPVMSPVQCRRCGPVVAVPRV